MGENERKIIPFSIENLEKIVTKVKEKKFLKAYYKKCFNTKHSIKFFFNACLCVYDSPINTFNHCEL